MSTRERLMLTTALVVAGVVLVAANSELFHVRFDLTSDRVHTISTVTRGLLTGLDDEVTITYYRSQRLANRFPQPREIEDLLDEYQARSDGNVRVRTVDPSTLARPQPVEDLGVVPQQLQVTDEGEQSIATVYSGIVVEYRDASKALPFVFSATTLEYDLTTAIREMSSSESRTVGFIIGDQTESLENTYRIVASTLGRSYSVREFAPGDPIPDDVDVAIVTNAELLTSVEVSRVSDYLSRGGAALVAAESVEVSVADGLSAREVSGAPIRSLLDRFGIRLGTGLVLDESANQIRVQEVAGGYRVTRTYPYAFWLATLQRFTSPDHPVTARFNGLDLYWPTYLEAPVSQIIVASTPKAWLMRSPYIVNPQQQSEFTRDASTTTGQYGLVAIGRGDGERPARVAVVADSDFLRDDLIQATGSTYNVDFVENLSQWLSNDEDLLSIRTRGSRDLTLDAIAEPAVKATVVFFAQAINIVLVPAVVAIVGIVRLVRRRRRSRSEQRS